MSREATAVQGMVKEKVGRGCAGGEREPPPPPVPPPGYTRPASRSYRRNTSPGRPDPQADAVVQALRMEMQPNLAAMGQRVKQIGQGMVAWDYLYDDGKSATAKAEKTSPRSSGAPPE